MYMKSREIEIWRDPYDQGWDTCEAKTITLHEGVTVLVGCNGIGKSTLLENIKHELARSNIPVWLHDNVADKDYSYTPDNLSDAFSGPDFEQLAVAKMSSEGENIRLNIGKIASQLRGFIQTGLNDRDRSFLKFKKILSDEVHDSDEVPISNERWILLDAIDSGFSIDNVIELKELFKIVRSECQSSGIDLYIVVSANEYELANAEQCFDVVHGEYITFNSYEDYKEYIMKTREEKEKRFEKRRKGRK